MLQMAVDNLRAFIDGVQAGGRLFFSADEIPRAEGSRALEAALRRLAKKGAIRRLLPKSPAFVIVPPEHRTMGLPPVEWWLDDLMTHLGQDYYLGLLSASAASGSSHFSPMETQVVTTKWIRPIENGRHRIRFFQKAAIPKKFVSTRQGAWGPLRISSPALTAFDLVIYPVCSPAQTRLLLADLAATVSTTDLLKIIEERRDVPAAQRLGLLLDRARASKLANPVRAWLRGRSTVPVDLEPNAGPGKTDDKWNVRVNVDLEATA
jgi:predicted transcriptional regulator of viral defense system